MRRLATYPAMNGVHMPETAEILDVVAVASGADLPPSLIVTYDDAVSGTRRRRRFTTLRPGRDTVPPGAAYVGSWRSTAGALRCLFELYDEVPAELPAEARGHYVALINDGFTLRPDRSWRAPDDMPEGCYSARQVIAVTVLQEHGYGDIVHA